MMRVEIALVAAMLATTACASPPVSDAHSEFAILDPAPLTGNDVHALAVEPRRRLESTTLGMERDHADEHISWSWKEGASRGPCVLAVLRPEDYLNAQRLGSPLARRLAWEIGHELERSGRFGAVSVLGDGEVPPPGFTHILMPKLRTEGWKSGSAVILEAEVIPVNAGAPIWVAASITRE